MLLGSVSALGPKKSARCTQADVRAVIVSKAIRLRGPGSSFAVCVPSFVAFFAAVYCAHFRTARHVPSPGVVGGAEEARTPDPLLAKEVLSQLSYGPGRTPADRGEVLVGHSGLEPETSVLSGLRSNQLS